MLVSKFHSMVLIGVQLPEAGGGGGGEWDSGICKSLNKTFSIDGFYHPNLKPPYFFKGLKIITQKVILITQFKNMSTQSRI
jgi:hypothetical protein